MPTLNITVKGTVLYTTQVPHIADNDSLNVPIDAYLGLAEFKQAEQELVAYLTEQQALEKLCNYINQNFKTQKEAAKSFEVTEGFLSMVLNGKKPITEAMANRLSLIRQTVFLERTSLANGDAAPVKSICYQEAYDALETQLIKEPIGNGLDQVAQNNGLIIAMNTLQKMNLAKQADMNLSCKSVQKRLATLWGYVKAEQAEQEPVATVVRNKFGVISLQAPNGGNFNLGKNVGMKLYAAPVRTKDMTDDEIAAALKLDLDLVTEVEFRDARAVIAADRENNK